MRSDEEREKYLEQVFEKVISPYKNIFSYNEYGETKIDRRMLKHICDLISVESYYDGIRSTL